MVEAHKTPWMKTAECLFLREFEDPKDFYKEFSEPISLYSELAKRAMQDTAEDEAVYSRMYRAYVSDQTNNNNAQLNVLITQAIAATYNASEGQ